MPTPTELREQWRARCEATLPPVDNQRRRNAAITRCYVAWYRQQPLLLKWAGCAAFASRQVGRALVLHHLLELGSGVQDYLKGEEECGIWKSLLDAGELEQQLRSLSITNNRVFADIGWVHAAFVDESSGLPGVEAALADEPESPILAAFRLIAEAVRLRDRGEEAEAARLVSQASVVISIHEQRNLVQPGLEHLGDAVSGAFSLSTWLDFDPQHAEKDSISAVLHLIKEGPTLLSGSGNIVAFYPFMRLNGDAYLQGRPPTFTRFDDRWYWTEHDVLPPWGAVSTSDMTLPDRMQGLGRLSLV